VGELSVARVGGLDEGEQNVIAAAAQQLAATLRNRELQRERREALTMYARQMTNAQEEERRRIARDLHDGATQALSGLCRRFDLLLLRQSDAEDSARFRADVEELRSVAEGTVMDLRRVTRDLRPTILDDLGLLAGIEWLASDLRERTDLDVVVSERPPFATLSTEQEVGVFRVVQEALSNVEKHARASRVEIIVQGDEAVLRVDVRDDGVGFDAPANPGALAGAGRYGVLGMQERASLNGGSLTIESAPGEGTTVSLVINRSDESP
jgi:signal transduction histidine kinase